MIIEEEDEIIIGIAIIIETIGTIFQKEAIIIIIAIGEKTDIITTDIEIYV